MTLPDPDRSYVVLIGTSRFTDPELPDLPAVRANLAGLQACFRDPALLGIPAQRCIVIADPQSSDALVDPVHEAASEADDTLLVYYAGHGLIHPRTNELLLAVVGSTSARPHTAVPYTWIRDNLVDARARRRIVILDCCYSGRAFGGMADPTTALADEASAEGTFLLAAAPPNKQALSPPGERYTAFTGALLTVLTDGTEDGPALLDLDHIYRQVRDRLRRAARPLPQRRAHNTAGDLALVRNRLWSPITSTAGGPPGDPEPASPPRQPVGHPEPARPARSDPLPLTRKRGSLLPPTNQAARIRRRTSAIAGSAIAVALVTLGVYEFGIRDDNAGQGASPTSTTTGPTTGRTPGPCGYTATPSDPAVKEVTIPADPADTPKSGVVELVLTTNNGAIPLVLDRAQAPCTVQSIIHLATAKFYDGSPCHRLVAATTFTVLQCGDPGGTGTGGPGYTIPDELPTHLQPAPTGGGATVYPRGTVAMANTGQPHSGGSQFFLVIGPTHLLPGYTIFGTVADAGLAVLDTIVNAGVDDDVEVSGNHDGAPALATTITTATVTGTA